MKKNTNLAKELLNIALLLAPFVFLLLKWDSFPKRVPIHFDVAGNPDSYRDKAYGLLIVPGINVLLYLILLLLPRIDPRKAHYALFGSTVSIIRLLLTAFFSFVAFAMMLHSLGYHIEMTVLICYGVAALMLVLGNYIGTVRSNFFFGIRTPWTLSSEEVWTRTHRVTGRLWVISSLLFMLSGLFLPLSIPVLILYISVILFVPVIYSYVLYKKLKGEGSGKPESGS
jgi:uncharacterized membrane protein